MKYPLEGFFVCLIFFLLPKTVSASSDNQFVTIVNPVRISKYTSDSYESVNSQYSVVKRYDLPATWLLTYDVLMNDKSVSLIKTFDESQEIGLFFEITPGFSKESGVPYNDSGSWHYATSVFLSGYTKEERIKLIDTLFNRFKSVFGYYPVSVGAWWIDSYSLEYMSEKYGVIANLGLADQYSTDGYQVWGTYWSTPYYPNKNHAGIPASNKDDKLDVVTVQWAPRDPLNGYYNSYYSTQDYFQNPVNQDTSYFEKLLELYSRANGNLFGQIVVGLEGDLSAEAYEAEFAKQVGIVDKLKVLNEIKVLTMRDFSDWYRNRFTDVSPVQITQTDDLLGKPIKVIWYQNPRYRIGLTYNYENSETKIFDFRSYHRNFQEPFYSTPNKELDLSIYIPSYFDEVNSSESLWKLNLQKLKDIKRNGGNLTLFFENGKITFDENFFSVESSNQSLPRILIYNPNLHISFLPKSITIKPKNEWVVDGKGYYFRDLSDVATRELMRKRTLGLAFGFSIIFIGISYLIIISKMTQRQKLVLLTLIIVPTLFCINVWYFKNSTIYYVSQAEIDALIQLSSHPKGRVLVYGKECLGCNWTTPEKPAVFSNKRNYIGEWGKHPVVYNTSVFEAENHEEARREFDKLDVSYVYVTKYGGYIERIPFSPGDLNVEKIYDNANAEVWRVKD